jgi:hypothetical protein
MKSDSKITMNQRKAEEERLALLVKLLEERFGVVATDLTKKMP